NANGKVDRKKLLLYKDEIGTNKEFIMPVSHREKIIAGIWQEVLQYERGRVGLKDNFFDLGGNSLSIMRVRVKIKEQLGIDIPVTVLFQYPTVGSLARRLGHLEGSDLNNMIDKEKKEMDVFNRLDDDINETLQIFET
ncbi:MAG: phosphopantetheine-binding protein, partial [Acidobacteria bacterium]|nr:phosphopantetheine-binding protein [Acidobacteriota bacterium]